MNKIGIFFGTDTGTTRLIAKKLAKKLGDEVAAKPLNINRASLDDLMRHDVLVLGTPSYGEGDLPGVATGVKEGSWAEFLPQLESADFSGKTVALYGLGNQEKYSGRFADSLFSLYEAVLKSGAAVIGEWSTEGYHFAHSKSVVDGRFVGLVIDNNSQGFLTEERLDTWVAMMKPRLSAALDAGSPAAVGA